MRLPEFAGQLPGSFSEPGAVADAMGALPHRLGLPGSCLPLGWTGSLH